ncbi:glycosyltransferase family 1 protein [Altererythrobacter sp. MF3-039]|uniref:glycosyltransferase family 1 protein n=1 Tax=Altererythrobacter sp. MF3-039 TaxID=3252901 RepID=UPI00390C8D82
MPKLLHIHSDWDGSPIIRRSIAVAQGLGTSIQHQIHVVGGFGSRRPPGSPFRRVSSFPKIEGVPTLGKLQKIAKAMLGYDLVCTYGYGAINAAMAHTAFSQAFALPALLHHEPEDAERGLKADIYRRVALGKCAGLVVPDERIEEAALVAWQQPMGRVKLIPEGIDLKPWRKTPPGDMLREVVKRPGEKWAGMMAANWPAGMLAAMMRAFAELTDNWQLVILGEVENSESVRDMAAEIGIGHRVHLATDPDPSGRSIGLLEIVLLPEESPDCGLAAIRAMAGGAAVITEPKSVAAPLLPDSGQEFVLRFDQGNNLGIALTSLAADQGLRETLAEEGRDQVKAAHDEKVMIATYKRLYASAMMLA